jgi:lipoprotein NlpD
MILKLGGRLAVFLLLISLTGCERGQHIAPVTELKWQPYTKYQRYHKVLRGETLYAIAFRYDTDYRQLARLNHLRPPYSLRVGQMLNIQGLARRPQTFRKVVPKRTASNPVSPRTEQKIIYSPTKMTYSASGWLWPAVGRVATTFIPEQGKKGINIACKRGDKIHAASAGVVAYAGSGLAGYGNLIIIKHNNEYLTAYGNSAKNLVSEGQRVKSGQMIAEVGLIDHRYYGVHFEIRKAGKPVNPLNYLKKG